MIERILPAAVHVASRSNDVPETSLFPLEQEYVMNAVEKRRREFATGRACAREALGQLGLPPRPLPVGRSGAPEWPAEVVGSITHCAGYRASAVARRADFATLGIDAEPNEAVRSELLPDIALPGEIESLRATAATSPDVHWDKLLFCIKEAVYKAWFPLAGRWLGFEDAIVDIDAKRGSFLAKLRVDGPTIDGQKVTCFRGKWVADGGLLLAAIAMPSVQR